MAYFGTNLYKDCISAINVDAAYKQQKSASGVIIRDDQGTPIYMAGYFSTSQISPLNVELRSVIN